MQKPISAARNTSVFGAFFKYVVPSVLAFALSGIYAIVDGFFVGQSIGDKGLSAINVAFPVVSLIQSLGTGIGMGGAVLWSVRRGEKDGSADTYLRATLWMLLFASAFMTAFFFLNEPVLRLFGAEGDIYAYGKEYLDVIVLGSVFQIFATGLVPAIRNNGGATFAFITMLSGFGSNIVLDYVFVWVLEGGTAGAAVATILGQAVTAIEALLYFLIRKLPLFGSFRRFGRCAASIVRVGVAPFGLTLSPMISLMLINKFCMLHGGESAVACYACIAYAVTIVQMLVQGVGDGSQPLISTFYGEGSPEKSAKVRFLAPSCWRFCAAYCSLSCAGSSGRCSALRRRSHGTSPPFCQSSSSGCSSTPSRAWRRRAFTRRNAPSFPISRCIPSPHSCSSCSSSSPHSGGRRACGGAPSSRRS